MASDVELAPRDVALLERLAARIVALRMEVPAILALESGRPLSVIAAQSLLFFEPFVRTLFGWEESQRFAALIERRETIETFIRMIERQAEAGRTARGREGAPPAPPSEHRP